MKYYSYERLMKVAEHRGYVTVDSIAISLMKIFGEKKSAIKRKLTTGNLKKEECEVIGSFFEMSMKEYYDVFINGLFVEDQEGHYVCRVDEPYLHLHPKIAKAKGKTRKDKVDELLQQIEDIGKSTEE